MRGELDFQIQGDSTHIRAGRLKPGHSKLSSKYKKTWTRNFIDFWTYCWDL